MTIDQTIERELLGGRDVSIPFVGTLSVDYIAAQFVDGVGSSMIPPRGAIAISEDYVDRRSIIFIYAQQSCNSDIGQATLIYNDWLVGASVGDQLVVDGVCSIDLEHFTLLVCECFDNLLAPAGLAPVSVGRLAPVVRTAPARRPSTVRAKRNNVSVTLALLAVIFAAIYIVYYLFFTSTVR